MKSKNILILVLVIGLLIVSVILTGAFEGKVWAEGLSLKADIIIVNGNVFTMDEDNPSVEAIAIREGKILAIGRNQEVLRYWYPPYTEVIDAGRKVVAPGFIDIHTHSDSIVETDKFAENQLRQGTTLVVVGNCGGSPSDLRAHFEEIMINGIGLNYAQLYGHNVARREAMEDPSQIIPTPAEMEVMKKKVAKAMQDGAVGLSTGLEYQPGVAAETEEVVALAEVAAKYGGFYATHMRDEADKHLEAVEEALLIGKLAEIPVQISHIKTVGQANWHKVSTIIKTIEEAREEQVVYADQYPYTKAGWSTLIMVEPWAKIGGTEAFLERLEDPEKRERIEEEILARYENWYGDPGLVLITSCEKYPEYVGKTMREILIMRGEEPTVENAMKLNIEFIRWGGVGGADTMITEEWLEEYMVQPWVMVGSDSSVREYGRGVPHPRNYGTFPRVLGRYVRDEGVISLEVAIRKMTVLPAKMLGLTDRAQIKEGFWADLVIFDPDKIIDKADWNNPHQYPEGISEVLVNGCLVIKDGDFIAREKSLTPGMIIYGPGYNL